MTCGARASVRGRGADPIVAQGHRMFKIKFFLSSTGCNRSAMSCGLISPNQSVFWQTAQNRVSVSKRPSLWMSARQLSLYKINPPIQVFMKIKQYVASLHRRLQEKPNDTFSTTFTDRDIPCNPIYTKIENRTCFFYRNAIQHTCVLA